MKRLITIFILITSLILLTSCANKDEAAEDIMTYYNEIWIPINQMKKDRFDEMNPQFYQLDAKEDKTEAGIYIEEKIIPTMKEVIAKLEDVKIDNRQAKKMNKLQIKAEKFSLKAFKHTIQYYEGDYDEADLIKDHKKLEDLYIDVIDYQEKVFEQYDLTKSNEKIGNFTSVERK